MTCPGLCRSWHPGCDGEFLAPPFKFPKQLWLLLQTWDWLNYRGWSKQLGRSTNSEVSTRHGQIQVPPSDLHCDASRDLWIIYCAPLSTELLGRSWLMSGQPGPENISVCANIHRHPSYRGLPKILPPVGIDTEILRLLHSQKTEVCLRWRQRWGHPKIWL